MQNRRNYYRVLHVQPDAPVEIIRSSYRALMLQLEMHPDRGGDHWNAALINEAWSVLSDADRRREYDRGRADRTSQTGFEARASSKEDPDGTSVEQSPSRDRAASSVDTCVFCQTPCSLEATEDPRGRCAVCGSPLFLAGRLDLATSGQRAASRIAQNREVRFSTDWPQDVPFVGLVRDISPRGMRLETEVGLQSYQIVRIDGGPLQATGRVTHCTSPDGAVARQTFGIEFFTLLIESGLFVSRRL